MEIENKIANRAIKTLKKEGGLWYFFVNYLLVKKHQNTAFILYYFLRWLDDTIDSSRFSKKQKLGFLKNEKRIVENVFAGGRAKKLNDYETGLLFIKRSETKIGVMLKRHVIGNYLKAFELELLRPQIVTKKWLVKYAYYVGSGFTNFSLIIANIHDRKIIIKNISKTSATASDLAHLLRDFRKDAKNGKINIPKEYIEEFDINTNFVNKNSQELRRFAKFQVNQIYRLFSQGEKYIKSLSSFTLRLGFTLLFLKYKSVLIKIVNRDYNLFSNYDKSTLWEQLTIVKMALVDFLRLAL